MENTTILNWFEETGLAKLKNYGKNKKYIRRTIQIKNICNGVKTLREEEINEMTNIIKKIDRNKVPPESLMDNVSTENVNESEYKENKLNVPNVNRKLGNEEKKRKGEEKNMAHLTMHLERATMIKHILELTSIRMRKGMNHKKFNQYAVRPKKEILNLRKPHSFCFKMPERAIEYNRNESFDSKWDELMNFCLSKI